MLVMLFWLFSLFIYLLIDLMGAWFIAWVITLVIGLGCCINHWAILVISWWDILGWYTIKVV